MKRDQRRSIRIGAIVLAIAVFGACGDPTPSAQPSPSIGPFPLIGPVGSSAVASTDGSPASPSSGAALLIDALPNVELDQATQTAVCDPEASQLDTEAGEAAISCFDGLVLGLRALTTLASAPFERLYLQRPRCQATPCTDDELSVAAVTGWTATEAFSVILDSRQPTVKVTKPEPATIWPPGSSETPTVGRPLIADAPGVIAARPPYPYCGEAELDEPQSVTGCFRDAVLSGRPAELLDRYVGTEEGPITRLYRFDGRGAISSYIHTSAGWLRQAGSMILGSAPREFGFEPWSGTDRRF